MTKKIPITPPRRRAAALLAALPLLLPALAAQAADAQDYSPAEKLLFMSDQLGALRLPATLRYGFRKSGSLEEGFDDRVSVAVKPGPDGKCCNASGEFLGGARRVALPEVEGASGNPVLMFFLERDVREMQRLTKGSQGYFRKRIRMAVYGAATVRELPLQYQGKELKGREVLIKPYVDDPNSAKFAQLTGKEYRFWLAEGVPGGVFGVRARVPGATAEAAPLMTEELLIDGGAAPR